MTTTVPYAELYDEIRRHGYHEEEDATSHLAPYVAWLKQKTDYRSVLDIGCSAGGSLTLLTDENRQAYGVDVSQIAVSKAVLRDLQVTRASATNLPFEDNAFDLVVSADVFEHLHEDDAPRAAAEAIRVARRFIFMKIAEHEDVTQRWKDLAGHPLHLTTRPIEWWMQHFEHAGEFIRYERSIFCLKLRDNS